MSAEHASRRWRRQEMHERARVVLKRFAGVIYGYLHARTPEAFFTRVKNGNLPKSRAGAGAYGAGSRARDTGKKYSVEYR